MANDYDASAETWTDSCFDQYNQPVARKCSGGELGLNDAVTLTTFGMSLRIPAMGFCKCKDCRVDQSVAAL